MKTLPSLLFCFLICCSISAQKNPVKWGKVDQADLDMKVYDLDPEAEAVVLIDYGNLEFDFTTGDIFYILEHHVRIKILKKSAFDRGDISIPYYSHLKSEKISGLKAQVILPNGKKLAVSKKDIFDEKYNDYWSVRKFAAPGLEEGCIIEYRYRKKSDQIYYLTDWYFQTDIPTRLSEFRTHIPEWFKYVSFNQGLDPETAQEKFTKMIPLPRYKSVDDPNAIGRRGATMAGGSVDALVLKNRYYLENIPALKSENYITTMQDYYAKLSLQLQSVKFPNSPPQNMTTSWKKVAENMEEDSSFGDQLNKKRHSKKIMKAIAPELAAAKDDMEKIGIIYNFISKNIKWNDEYGFYCNSLDDIFEKKTGDSGELNMIFMAICRQSGITTYPVLVSTRSHGKMMEYYPKTDQFNHVIAFVETGDQQFLFDVGSPHRDPNLLRMSSLNFKGWLVDKENSQWINIPVPTDNEVTMATVALDDAGNLSGSINQSFKGYCAMDGRYKFYQNKSEDHKHIKEKWQKDFPDVSLKAVDFKDHDKVTKPLKCMVEIELPEAAQVSGDLIYFSPMLNAGYNENPLKAEKRTFPVDISVKSKEQYILNLTIPDGYVVDELPESVSMKMEGNSGRFQFNVSQNGNKVQLTSKVTLSKVRFEPAEYAIIKNFFDLIVEKHGEQIVLKKG